MRRVVVDANAFLRLFLNDIPKQADEVEKLLKRAKEGIIELFIPQITIFEIAFALDKYYHFSKEEITEKLKSVVAASYLKIQSREVFKRSLRFFDKENLSLADCFLASYAKQKGIAIFTFDKDLKKVVRKHR